MVGDLWGGVSLSGHGRPSDRLHWAVGTRSGMLALPLVDAVINTLENPGHYSTPRVPPTQACHGIWGIVLS